mmetsp:Transcript_2070/g.5808  ORF Transcript_2070/g.5808 Transcript_2070/m.5808 type:complete len:84 (+) Transcript_2070:182-433(+)
MLACDVVPLEVVSSPAQRRRQTLEPEWWASPWRRRALCATSLSEGIKGPAVLRHVCVVCVVPRLLCCACARTGACVFMFDMCS